jgi:hypothetical protein
MHSKRHRRERQRIAAFRFQCRAARQCFHYPGGRNQRVAQIWRDFVVYERLFIAKAQRQAQKITTSIICTGLHRVPLPCGNYATTGNPVTVRTEP